MHIIDIIANIQNKSMEYSTHVKEKSLYRLVKIPIMKTTASNINNILSIEKSGNGESSILKGCWYLKNNTDKSHTYIPAIRFLFIRKNKNMPAINKNPVNNRTSGLNKLSKFT